MMPCRQKLLRLPMIPCQSPLKHKRIAVQVPDHGGPAHRHKALDHDRQNVLTSDQAAIKERQTRRHEHDQAGAKKHESGVTGIEMKHEASRRRARHEQ